MSRIRSLGARLTGRHINTATERISVVSDKIPMTTVSQWRGLSKVIKGSCGVFRDVSSEAASA